LVRALGRRVDKGPNERGRGLFIEETSLLHVRSNFDLDLLLGLNLIWLDLRLDVNF